MRVGLVVGMVLVGVASPVSAQPGRVDYARLIRARVARTPAYRESYVGPAVWEVRPEAVWSLRPAAACLADLAQAGVPFRPMAWTPTPVSGPVEIVGPIEGVRFEKKRDGARLFVSCELGLRLPALARLLRAHGVTAAEVMSAYRREPLGSFHSSGLALDLSAFETERGRLSVEDDFEATPDVATCGAAPRGVKARALLAIACDLARSGPWSTVLTPNYNEGHRDHFHIDLRPEDPRVFVR